ncbi:MAG TPA: hypothetical protein VHM25_02085 [Polyangiaceae bacterium]|nr:hypothetical protein [Polyangiaceae bacterium]
MTEIANGWYKVAGNATDTNTLGPLALHATATGADACDLIVANIVSYNPQDAVRLGLTALPNAAAAAANGLPILGANAQAISFTAGMTISNTAGSALTLSSSGSNGNGLAASGNGTGDGIAATGGATGRGIHAVGGATSGAGIRCEGTAGNSNALELAGQGSAAGLSTTGGATGNGATFAGGATSGHGIQATKVSGNEIDADLTGAITGNITGNLSGSVGSVTGAVGSVTGNVGGNVTGSVGSVTGLTASNLDATVSSRLASASYTAPLDAAGTRTAVGLASANLDAQLSTIAGYIDTEVAAIKAKTDNLPASPAATGDVTGLLTTQLTESYAADGAAPTLTQALLAIQQFLQERAVAGTTLTVKKLDGTTAAMTFTLDDGTNPTALTRAT